MDYASYLVIATSLESQERQRVKWQANYERSFLAGYECKRKGLEKQVPWQPLSQMYDPDGFYDGFDSYQE